MIWGRNQGWQGRKVDPLSLQTKYNTPRSTQNTFWHNQKEIQQAVLEENPLRETQHEKQGKIAGKQQAVLKRANPRGAPESSNLFSQCFSHGGELKSHLLISDRSPKAQSSVYSCPQPYWWRRWALDPTLSKAYLHNAFPTDESARHHPLRPKLTSWEVRLNFYVTYSYREEWNYKWRKLVVYFTPSDY